MATRANIPHNEREKERDRHRNEPVTEHVKQNLRCYRDAGFTRNHQRVDVAIQGINVAHKRREQQSEPYPHVIFFVYFVFHKSPFISQEVAILLRESRLRRCARRSIRHIEANADNPRTF